MGFAHSQATAKNTVNGASTTLTTTLTNNPALGDVVCVGIVWFNATGTPPASLTVADGNSNAYTKSTHSPSSVNAANVGHAYIFYLNNAPANASKSIVATYTDPGASGAVELLADDFTVSGGTSAFDLDVAGNSTIAGTTINTPTVTRTGTGELLYCYAAPQSSITSVNTPWTQGDIGTDGTASGYILSASADTAVAMTCVSGEWDSIGASFSFTASSGDTLSAQAIF